MNIDLESFSPSCCAVLLREPSATHAPQRFTALASGIFTLLKSSPCIEAGHVRMTASPDGEKLWRGIFYARTVLIQDGKTFPAPRVGDVLALTIGRDIVAGFEVRAVGDSSPGEQLISPSLASDEVIVEFRSDLPCIGEMRAHVENEDAAHRQVQRGQK